MYSLSASHLYKENTSGHISVSRVLQFIQRVSGHCITKNATLRQKSEKLLKQHGIAPKEGHFTQIDHLTQNFGYDWHDGQN